MSSLDQNGSGQAPTRAALLELINEQAVVNEAYVFLDEKRLLLAAEMLRQLNLYQQLNSELVVLQKQAGEAMMAAARYHGLDGLQVYPSAAFDSVVFNQKSRNFMGVILLESELIIAQTKQEVAHEAGQEAGKVTRRAGRDSAANPSIKADLCKQLYRDIVVKSGVLAGLSGNLFRLLSEYRLTERRSRALENVILPEIENSRRIMTAHLEELDLEDAIRVHLQSRKQR